jgi:hypothetical protein
MTNDFSGIEDFPIQAEHSPTLPSEAITQLIENDKAKGTICPNCGAPLEGRKCKLFCIRRGCGYLVTCSEW